MKNNILLFAVFLLVWCSLSSCKTTAPSFKTVDNIRFERLDMKVL